METMFMIPGLANQMAAVNVNNNSRVAPTTTEIKRNDTHDTCSCGGSDINASATTKQQQSSVLDASSLLLSSSSHIRTTSTPAPAPATPTAAVVATATLTTTTTSTSSASEPFGMLEISVAEDLVKKTEQRVQHVLRKATLPYQTSQSIDPVPKFSLLPTTTADETDGDLTRLEMLGSGGFASVYSVDIQDPTRLRFHKPGQQYVVKHLSPKLAQNGTSGGVSNRRKLHAGAKDIVLESHILAALNHKNIVAVHGVSRGGIQAYSTTLRTDAYFMILPRLDCTLADKISAWKKERLQKANAAAAALAAEKETNPRGSWLKRRLQRSSTNNKNNTSCELTTTIKQQIQAQQLEFICERLEIVEQLCEAVEYLHSKRIMHRDIKPPNIGFDKDGCLKLFDFGLAKELPVECTAYSTPVAENNHHSNSNSNTPTIKSSSSFFSSNSNAAAKSYQNLGNTGTTRYMAPEVIRRDPYNCKVDVYATSIVCWELMTLKKPYGTNVSGQFVKELVALYDDRPMIPSSPSTAASLFTSSTNTSVHKLQQQAMTNTVWPKSLKALVQQGWIKDINSRLTATQMKHGLGEIITKKKQQLNQLRIQMENENQPSSTSLKNSKKNSANDNNTQNCVISSSLTTTMSC